MNRKEWIKDLVIWGIVFVILIVLTSSYQTFQFISVLILSGIIVDFYLEKRDVPSSKEFSVNATNAIFKHKRFGELAEIKSSQEGKEFDKWTEYDQNKYWK